jgi:hypothetical protein
MGHDLLEMLRDALGQGRLKEVIEFIKGVSLELVDPLDFLIADCLERCHGGLSGVVVIGHDLVFCKSQYYNTLLIKSEKVFFFTQARRSQRKTVVSQPGRHSFPPAFPVTAEGPVQEKGRELIRLESVPRLS